MAAALIGAKVAPEVITLPKPTTLPMAYWPSLNQLWAQDAERIAGLLQKQYDEVGPARRLEILKEPLPEGMGYNYTAVDKHEA
jgi:hypothetical protein